MQQVRVVNLDVCVQRDSKELKGCHAVCVSPAGLSDFTKNVFTRLNPPPDVSPSESLLSSLSVFTEGMDDYINQLGVIIRLSQRHFSMHFLFPCSLGLHPLFLLC